jgi:hypothetical protein
MPGSTHERNARLWKRPLSESFPHGAISPNLRNVKLADVPALGALFFAAFSGTVDDAGQTETQCASKATAILGGRYGEWIGEASWTIEQIGGLRSACLVSDCKPYGCPVIAVVATSPARKQLGDGGILLNAALASLTALGYRECCAIITEGNLASERLFLSRGFSPDADR